MLPGLEGPHHHLKSQEPCHQVLQCGCHQHCLQQNSITQLQQINICSICSGWPTGHNLFSLHPYLQQNKVHYTSCYLLLIANWYLEGLTSHGGLQNVTDHWKSSKTANSRYLWRLGDLPLQSQALTLLLVISSWRLKGQGSASTKSWR